MRLPPLLLLAAGGGAGHAAARALRGGYLRSAASTVGEVQAIRVEEPNDAPVDDDNNATNATAEKHYDPIDFPHWMKCCDEWTSKVWFGGWGLLTAILLFSPCTRGLFFKIFPMHIDWTCRCICHEGEREGEECGKIFVGKGDGAGEDLVRQHIKEHHKERIGEHEPQQFVHYDDGSPSKGPSGNIYRLLAVINNPGDVGLKKYIGLFVSCALTFYMQLYLPLKLMSDVMDKAQLVGIKPGEYWSDRYKYILSAAPALMNVAKLFLQSMYNIAVREARACHYILTHCRPQYGTGIAGALKGAAGDVAGAAKGAAGDMAGEAKGKAGELAEGAKAQAGEFAEDAKAGKAGEAEPLIDKEDIGNLQDGVDPGALAKQVGNLQDAVDPDALAKQVCKYPQCIVKYVEFFFCFASLLINTYVCLMMSIVMVIFIATFDGDVNDLLLKVVAMQFIGTIDEQICVAQPELCTLYDRQVKDQTEQREEKLRAKVRWMRVLYPRYAQVWSGLTLYVGLAWILVSFYVNRDTGERVGL